MLNLLFQSRCRNIWYGLVNQGEDEFYKREEKIVKLNTDEELDDYCNCAVEENFYSLPYSEIGFYEI